MADKRQYQVLPARPETDITIVAKTERFSREILESIGERAFQAIIDLHRENGGKRSLRFDPDNSERDAPMAEINYFSSNDMEPASLRISITIGLENHINPNGCLIRIPESIAASIIATQPLLAQVIALPAGINPEIKLWLSRGNLYGNPTDDGSVAGIFTDGSREEEEIILIGTPNR